jgi:hypothetical protein
MENEPTAFQKIMLRLAWENRQAAEVTFEEVAKEREIRGYGPSGEFSYEKFQVLTRKPERKDWFDLEEKTVLAMCFGVTYTPTPEQYFGLCTAADDLIESKQYNIAHQIVCEAMFNLDGELAEWIVYGPASWSGFPQRVAFNLTPAGVKLAQQLAREFAVGMEPHYRLDQDTQSRYLQALKRRGITLEDIAKAGQCGNYSGR